MSAAVDLSTSVAFVTGAGSGIGRATAMAFAARGAKVIVTDRDDARSEAVTQEIVDAGGIAVAHPCDVTDTAQLEAVRDLADRRFGGVDIVMNNVGVIAMGPPETLPLAEWQRVVDVNLLSVVRSNLTFLPGLIERGKGHVINTASVSGLLAHGYDRLPYVTTKHALVGMSESLAIYLRPKGIGVTCLCPSGVNTNIVEQISFFGAPSSPRSPDHRIVEADVVGRLVVDAVDTGRFLVLTEPSVQAELQTRAADIDAYIEAQIRASA
jgi:NAD(P)-dependent dehydrogenase (short-subunit alcohol dehydrogenase family)